ncbi:MAG TPA: type I-E CRISPR-associated endoribonuclease Cas2e [Armatimonadota bacterium]|jgi:CRISPR-associated protein Cas2
MIVLMVENAEPSLRGKLSRWMIQPKTGVFVGTLSARVRDRLWEKVIESKKATGALLVYQAQTEQGFQVRSWGKTDREPVDFEGLTLIRRPTDSKEHAEHYRKRERTSKIE